MSLYIQAIFNAIDGEANGFKGLGELSTFIRLKGCNLKCVYCDTRYAQNVEENDKKICIKDILAWPDMLNKITITGGEPLIQEEVEVLVYTLLGEGKRVSVETNGTQHVFGAPDDYNLRFVVDYKLPSSGMEDKMVSEVFSSLRSCDVIKFVIADFDDYYIARGLVAASGWSNAKKVFSPAIEDQDNYTGWPATLAQIMINDAKMLGNTQYSLQLHKILWPNAKFER